MRSMYSYQNKIFSDVGNRLCDIQWESVEVPGFPREGANFYLTTFSSKPHENEEIWPGGMRSSHSVDLPLGMPFYHHDNFKNTWFCSKKIATDLSIDLSTSNIWHLKC